MQYVGSANCHAYAFKLKVDPETGDPFTYKPVPGSFSTGAITRDDLTSDIDATKKLLETKSEADAKALCMTFVEVDSANHTPKPGNWIIALAYSLDGKPDFHWWVKDSNGYWSHKRGIFPVQYWDASNNKILDPAECDRGKYTYFLGYYEIGYN